MLKKIKLFLFVTSCLLFGACSFKPYETYNDEFRNGKKYVAQFDIAPEEFSEITYAHTVIERIVTDKKEEVNLYFIVTRGSMSFNIDNKAFIKTDNRVFDISISDITTECKDKLETTSVTTSKTDSTGTKTTKSDHTENRTWINDKFKLALSSELVEALKRCNEFKIGLSFGPTPATFVIREKRIDRVRKLLFAVD